MRSRAGYAAPEPEVARPRSFEEVTSVLRSGRRIVPRGGGSGVCGAVAPAAGDLVLDLRGLDEVEIDEVNLTVRAQAGVTGLRLEQLLNQSGLTLGHFPSSLPIATVGGLISTRSSGQQSTFHGNVEDMVMGMTVALPDGSVVATRRGPRSAAGPPLHELFVGAEGALGVILEATLRVHRQPEAVVGRGWRLESVDAGLACMREVIQRGVRPLVMRLYDPEDAALQGLEGGGCLLVAAAAGPRAVAHAEADAIAEAMVGEALGEEPWGHWVKHRFNLSAERLLGFLAPPGAYLDTIEVAAAWSVLPDLYAEVKAHLAGAAGVALCHFSHAYGQGCCAYFTFAGSAPDEAAAEATYEEAWRGAMEISLRHGATISHHHGVGQQRAPWIRAEMGGWWEVWRRVRQALDPDGRMNPHAVGGSSSS